MSTGMLFQRESPHWLVAQGREDETRQVLRRVRDEGGIDAEIAGVRALSGRRHNFREVLNPAVRHVMVIGVALAVFQQITGINTIIYYAPTLLSEAGLGNSAALLANVVNGAVNTLLSAIGNAGTFFLFAGLSIVALVYFQQQVPETRNRSLQDIERDLDLPERLEPRGAGSPNPA